MNISIDTKFCTKQQSVMGACHSSCLEMACQRIKKLFLVILENVSLAI